MNKPGLVLLAVTALCRPACSAAQELPRFRARAEVAVRTVRVVLTTRDGRPLAKPPSPNDIEVLEEGMKAEVLDVERLFQREPAPQEAGVSGPGEAEPSRPRPVRQVAYFETTLLSTPGLREAARALGALAPKLVTRGPLEIVVADPEPKVLLPPSHDAAEVRTALQKLGATVAGRDVLAVQRLQDAHDALAQTNSGAMTAASSSPDSLAATRNAERHSRRIGERILIAGVLDRIALWASRMEPEPGSVFILVSDGFDLDPDGFLSRVAGEADVATVNLDPRGPDAQIRAQLAGTTALLGSLGFAVFPLAAGPDHMYGLADSDGGRAPVNSRAALEGRHMGLAFERKEEPLIQVAAATGGEMSTTGDHLGGSLDRLSESYLVTFQAARPADGRVHALAVKARRDDVVVRAPSSIAGGTHESVARALALGMLRGEPVPRDLGVEAAMDAVDHGKSTLRLRIQLGDVPDLLAVTGQGRLRVSLAVGHGKEPPFVHHDEMPLVKKGEGRLYLYDSPVAGVAAGDRVAVLVEELETGYAGGTTLTIGGAAPKP